MKTKSPSTDIEDVPEESSEDTVLFNGVPIVFRVIRSRRYGGDITYNPKCCNRPFAVRFTPKKGEKYHKSFANRQEAMLHRRLKSEERGCTRIQIRGELVQPGVDDATLALLKRWAVGFMDGDACITTSWSRKNSRVPAIRINVDQARNEGIPREIILVGCVFGGLIIKAKEASGSKRAIWRLSISRESEVVPVLELMERHCIIDAALAGRAMEYIKSDRTEGKLCHDDLKYMHANEQRSRAKIHYGRIVPVYLAGLFAADGHAGVGPNGGVVMKITQKSCKNILFAIRDTVTLETGSEVTGSLEGRGVPRCLSLTGENAIHLAKMIRPFSLGAKTEQIDIALERVALAEAAGHPRTRTPEVKRRLREDLDERNERLKRLRHM